MESAKKKELNVNIPNDNWEKANMSISNEL